MITYPPNRLGLGCVTFGRETTEDEAFRIMDFALENGITLFDTAEAYGAGQAREFRLRTLGVDDVREVSGEMHSSEKIIGRWLKARGCRRQVTLLTKVTKNFTRSHVREAIAASLDRLGTDAVDIYMCHSFDPAVPLEESAAAMDAVVREGLAGAAGCSNHSVAQLQSCLAASRRGGLAGFEVSESRYNVLDRAIEEDLLPFARREGLGILAYSPLAGGYLARDYAAGRSAIPKGSRFDIIPAMADIYFKEENLHRAAAFRGLAERAGVPVAALATAWVLRRPEVSCVLIGPRSVAHVAEALAAQRLALDPEWIREIEAWK